MKNKNNLFWIFGILQAMVLTLIVYFILQTTGIGKDTQIVLSVLFSLFTLIIEYMIYSRR